MSNKLVCSRCGSEDECPSQLKTSTFAQCSYVCENCRCKSCGIVLNIECKCGERHADRSRIDPTICDECEYIRERVSFLSPEMLQLRDSELSSEEPLYESKPARRKLDNIAVNPHFKKGDQVET